MICRDRHLMKLGTPSLGLGLRSGFSGSGGIAIPALDLNFINGEALDGRITASGGVNGTRVNSSGLIVPATAPRFDYDPVTLVARGLLIEGARTNLVLRTDALDHAYWDAKNRITVSVDVLAGPDGTMNAEKIVETATSGEHQIGRNVITASTATLYAHSFYAKAGERTAMRAGDIYGLTSLTLFCNLNNGATSNKSGGTAGAVLFSAAAGNSWYRFGCADTSNATELGFVRF